VVDVGKSWSPRIRIQPLPQTSRVDTFTLYVVVRDAGGFDDAAAGAMGSRLRPDDEGLSIWRDDADPGLVRVSIDCPADDLDSALELGRALADETAASSPFDATVEEVVAMDDVQQLVWRAKP
jgi:hypothetical protein